jgi:hypothetical protein
MSSGKWVINDHPDKYGSFDGVIIAVGVCGEPKMPSLPDQNQFKGNIFHSSASIALAPPPMMRALFPLMSLPSRSDEWKILPLNLSSSVVVLALLKHWNSLSNPEPPRSMFFRDQINLNVLTVEIRRVEDITLELILIGQRGHFGLSTNSNGYGKVVWQVGYQ